MLPPLRKRRFSSRTSTLDRSSRFVGKPRELTRVGGLYYFVADSDQGPKLYRTDGSSAGTSAVPGTSAKHSYPSSLTAFGSYLLFAASDAFANDTRSGIDVTNGVHATIGN
jgi:ELWxxDGT repeat protein